MDHPNQNMEEFFRNSLDKFDEKPSANLWNALNARLDEDRSRNPILRWLKFLLPFLLLVGLFGTMYFTQHQRLNDYQIQISELTIEKTQLQNALKESPVPRIKEERIQEGSDLSVTQAGVKTEYVTMTDTVYLTKYVDRFIDRYIENTLPTIDLEYFSTSTSENSFYDRNRTSLLQPNLPNSRHVPIARTLPLSATNMNNSKIKSEENGDFTDRTYVSNLSAIKKQKVRAKDRKKRKIPKAPIFVNKLNPWGTPEFYYKAGISVGQVTTLKGDISPYNSTGFNFGIIQEFGLTTRFAIRLAAHSTLQEYVIGNNSEPLSNQLIRDFPNQSQFDSEIISIEVNSNFLEFPLNLKYDYYQDNLKSFFFTAGLKWSLLTEQEFNYFLTDNRVQFLPSDNRFGYLNAIHLGWGIEKPINAFTSYQVGIGFEMGVEPVGLEKQRLNRIDARFNLLFGKK